MICEPLAGQCFVTIGDQHTWLDWDFVVVDLVENIYPEAESITLVQDKLPAHKPSALYELFEPEESNVSWINLSSSSLLNLAVGLTLSKLN